MNNATPRLDIIVPVYNEGDNIVPTMRAPRASVKTPNRILICYDREDDNTLPAIRSNRESFISLAIEFVRNHSRGAHGAVLTGFSASTAPFVLVFPADDDFNAGIIDAMVAEATKGCDIVCASQFMAGGSMVGCPWLKAVLVRAASFTLYHVARLPTHDCEQRLSSFLAPRVGRDRNRVGAWLLLQHRVARKVPSPSLANWRGARPMDRADPRCQPLPGDKVASGLLALVYLRVRHHLFAAAGGKRAP